MIIWFTGFSGSGKSTIANEIKKYTDIFILDGDALRDGLNKDLDFSVDGRTENLRRAAHIAKIIESTGKNVLATFITPLESHRKIIKEITNCEFVWIKTSLKICINRDPKGLYEKAINGEIKNFTGLDSPYTPPIDYRIKLNTKKHTPKECALKVLNEFNLTAWD